MSNVNDVEKRWRNPAVLFAGAVGAFYKTYRVWREGGTWPIWHGAGWFLLALTLLTLGLPMFAVSGIE